MIVKVKFLWGNIAGITLFPFIFVIDKYASKKLINHEKIHLRQQVEMLIIPFYVVYLLEYIIRLFKHASHRKAYRNISFEREAYDNERNKKYLANRKFWSWIKYL